MNPSSAPARIRFQPHIEGLRALSVVAVVSHHVGLGATGFLGVDAFFVISGFLITSLLIADFEQHGTVRLGEFYARRARRILPLAGLVIAVAVLAVAALGNQILTTKAGEDGQWASAFAANVHHLRLATDYFATDDARLLRNYWSLAVEEQFYLVWPMLLLVLIWLTRDKWRRAATFAAAIITLASFGLALSLQQTNPTAAYFMTQARAWELGVGALLALVLTQTGSVTSPLRGTALLLPLVLLLWWEMPVANSLIQTGLVVLLTAVLIWRGANTQILSSGFMVRIGKRSFGWYLWHWPLLIILRYVVNEPSLLQQIVAAGLAYLLSELSFRFFENPIRYNPRLQASPPVAITVGLAAVTTSFAISTLALSGIQNAAEPAPSPSASSSTTPPGSPSPSTTASDSPSASASASNISPSASTTASPTASSSASQPPALKVQPLVGPLQGDSAAALLAQVQSAIQGAVDADIFPTKMLPRLGDIVRDRSAWFENGCSVDFASTDVPTCVGGDATSSKVAVLYGDSHATMWMPALDRIGKTRGWKIVLFAKLACPLIEEPVWSYQLNKPFDECQTWQAQVLPLIEGLKPQLIIATDQWKPAVLNGKKDDAGVKALWQQSFLPAVTKLKSYTDRLVVLGNLPNMTQDPATCLSQRDSEPWLCTSLRDDAEYAAINYIEKSATKSAGGTYINVMQWACTVQFCPTVIGGRVAYFDQWHFTDTYVRWLEPLLQASLNM